MVNRWGKQWQTILRGSKVTADGDCSHEIKRWLCLWRNNLDSIFKSRDITFPTKVHLVKAMVFPVVMYGCELDCKESWAPKNWCFWTVVLERLLRVPWTARRSKQYILTEMNPEYLLERLMLKLKLQYFGHLMWCWERLKVGGEWDNRGWDGWMSSLTQWTWVWVTSGSWWWPGRPGLPQSMGSQRVGHDWATQVNWTELWLAGNWAASSVLTFIYWVDTVLLC